MTQFRLDGANGGGSVVDLVWNALSANSWGVVSGDVSLLEGAQQGTWIFSAVQNDLTIFAASGQQAVHLKSVNMALDPTDPFSNLRSGDSGQGLTSSGEFFTWTYM